MLRSSYAYLYAHQRFRCLCLCLFHRVNQAYMYDYISDCKILIFIPIGSPVMAPQSLSSLDLAANTSQLGGHNAKLTVYLYEGFTSGFRLYFEGLRISFYANYNLLSAEQNPEIVSTISGIKN